MPHHQPVPGYNFVGVRDNLSLMEVVNEYNDDHTTCQPSRNNESNTSVQEIHITPVARDVSEFSPAYSEGDTPQSPRVQVCQANNGDDGMEAEIDNSDNDSGNASDNSYSCLG